MSLPITIEEYLAELKLTHQTRLIVEGKSDRMIFSKLLTLYATKVGKQFNLQVDTTDRIKDSPFPLSRGRIVEIFKRVSNQPYKNKLIGLIDREFYDFSFDPELHDILTSHKVTDRLVWTRGHSIENYFFRGPVLTNALYLLASSPEDHTASIKLFEDLFEDAIRTACGISLASKDIGETSRLLGIYDRVGKTISTKIINLLNQVEIDKIQWRLALLAQLEEEVIVDEFLEKFEKWLPIVGSAEFNLIRWICHGHIGMRFISAFYSACLIKVGVYSKIDQSQRELLSTGNLSIGTNEMKLAVIAGCWAKLSIDNSDEHPAPLLDLLS